MQKTVSTCPHHEIVTKPNEERARWSGYTEATGIIQINKRVRDNIQKNWGKLPPSRRYLHTNI